MIETIIEAKKKADIVIMCLHSGGQFNSEVGPYTQHLFDIITNAGADAIICNHAHKILPVYKKDSCIIASALGNFSFAPGEGYWIDGVKAEYSSLLSFRIEDKKIQGFTTDFCKCIRNDKGLAITIPVNDDKEIVTIK
jgi:poly-gamma-glutamate synthesis protein (capsule biosynthesis protein)